MISSPERDRVAAPVLWGVLNSEKALRLRRFINDDDWSDTQALVVRRASRVPVSRVLTCVNCSRLGRSKTSAVIQRAYFQYDRGRSVA